MSDIRYLLKHPPKRAKMDTLSSTSTDETATAVLSTSCLPQQIDDDLPDGAIESETEDSNEVSIPYANLT